MTLQELRTRLSAARRRPPVRVVPELRRRELRAAIAGAELVCHFQPQVSFRSGELVGVECLVRWQHPKDGLVYPDAFIGVAEEAGLIDDLTDAVFIEALGHARRWEDSGLALRLSVNVSMDNLSCLDFPDRVARQLLASGVAARSLVLEVTESRFMKNPLATIDILARLRLKHVGLSIDDFGTGHSSMTQLRDIPFDELKVDRGFVNGATSSASCLAIVEASLSIVRQLKLRSVAEGVETEAEWRLLRGLGCDVAQGYLIARPMPADALPAWAQEWEARAGARVGRVAERRVRGSEPRGDDHRREGHAVGAGFGPADGTVEVRGVEVVVAAEGAAEGALRGAPGVLDAQEDHLAVLLREAHVGGRGHLAREQPALGLAGLTHDDLVVLGGHEVTALAARPARGAEGLEARRRPSIRCAR
ncbi:MAG: EAL domain-containing protein [Deltaproteobacteria bacterium]|nr:EAL domain-containing protein [Deltaproteobacteria bacterium]